MALTGTNTARLVADGVPDGLGLKMIKKFIEENGGDIYTSKMVPKNGCPPQNSCECHFSKKNRKHTAIG